MWYCTHLVKAGHTRVIVQFFYPLRPLTIDLLAEYGTGRPSGEAIVEFLSLAERDDALSRDRKNIGNSLFHHFSALSAIILILAEAVGMEGVWLFSRKEQYVSCRDRIVGVLRQVLRASKDYFDGQNLTMQGII